MSQANTESIVRRSCLWGIGASATLLAVYFLTLTLSNSLNHAAEEFKILGAWIVLLTAGFGIQAGLFVYVRKTLKARATAQATATMAAAGGMSATAMIACCLHHLTDFIPILGVSAASLFLTSYQATFLAVGVASNLLGITFMLRLIQRQQLYESGHGILGRLLKFNMNRALVINLVLGLVFITAIYMSTI